MNKITKILVVLAAALPLLFRPTVCAKATIAGDGATAALLIQQIAQFVQDLDIGSFTIADLNEKWDRVERITQIVADGKKAYTTTKSIGKIFDLVKRCQYDCISFFNFLKRNSNGGLRLTNAQSLYNTFEHYTGAIMEEGSQILENVTTLFAGGSANDIMQSISNTLDEVQTAVSTQYEQLKTQMIELCSAETREQVTEENGNFVLNPVS